MLQDNLYYQLDVVCCKIITDSSRKVFSAERRFFPCQAM